MSIWFLKMATTARLELSDVTSHWQVNTSVCLANIIAYWTWMTGKSFYNKMGKRSGAFFFRKMLETTLGAEPCGVRSCMQTYLTVYRSKPCKHCALSFKWNACSSNYTYAQYIMALGLSCGAAVSAAIENDCFVCHRPSLSSDHLWCMFCSCKWRWSWQAIVKKTIGSGSAHSVQRETWMIILFRM